MFSLRQPIQPEEVDERLPASRNVVRWLLLAYVAALLGTLAYCRWWGHSDDGLHCMWFVLTLSVAPFALAVPVSALVRRRTGNRRP